MGIDYLDLIFKIEKKHGVHVKRMKLDTTQGRAVYEADMRKNGYVLRTGKFLGIHTGSWDIRAGDFWALVQSLCEPACQRCKMILEGFPREGACPRCHRGYVWSDVTWDSFREVLGEICRTAPEKVGKESWLIGDLGFS